jgi:hypothetical protein
MSIPLVQDNEKDSINTSIIAIKRNIERINMLLGLVDNDSPDLSGFATKQELQDAVTELQPVDEVTVGNMQSVTSNAVAVAFGEWELLWSSGSSTVKGVETKNGKYLALNIQGFFSGTLYPGSLLLTITNNNFKPSITNRLIILALLTNNTRQYCNLDYNTDGTLKFYPPSTSSISVNGLYGNFLIKLE